MSNKPYNDLGKVLAGPMIGSSVTKLIVKEGNMQSGIKIVIFFPYLSIAILKIIICDLISEGNLYQLL